MKPSSNRSPIFNGKRILLFALIITTTIILMALILTATRQTGPVVLAVTIISTVLILSVTGKAELLPTTLRAILSEIRRMVQPGR